MKNRHELIGCEEVQRLIAERSERTLRSEEAELVSEALAECSECRRFFDLHDETVELFITAHTEAAPTLDALISPDFTDRVLARLPNLQGQSPGETQSPNTTETPKVRPLDATQTLPSVPTTTPEPHTRRRGKLRRFPTVRIAAAAAAMLFLTVVGYRLLTPKRPAELDQWSGAVVQRMASDTKWLPPSDRPILASGDALYACPDNNARLELAGGAVVRLGGDTMVTLLASGPRVSIGTVSINNETRGPYLFATPLGDVTVEAGTDAVISVDRPFDRATDETVRRGDLIVWVRKGTARIEVDGRHDVLGNGQQGVITAGSPLLKLPRDEFAALRTRVARSEQSKRPGITRWIPRPETDLRASVAATIAAGTPRDRTAAITIAGRLGFDRVITQALEGTHASGETNAPYRRALIEALVRADSKPMSDRVASFLDDPDASVRTAAATALGVVAAGDVAEKSAEHLRTIARDTNASAEERLAATTTLAGADMPVTDVDPGALAATAQQRDAIQTIKDLTKSAHLKDPAAIARLAGMMTDRALSVDLREQAYTILIRVQDPSTAPAFIALLDDPNPKLRRYGIDSLSERRIFVDPLPADLGQKLATMATSGETPGRMVALETALARGVVDYRFLSKIVRDANAPTTVRVAAAEGYTRIDPRPTAQEISREISTLESTRDTAAIVGKLVASYGDVATANEKRLPIDKLSDMRPEVVDGAAEALSAFIRRKIPFTAAEVDQVQRALAGLNKPEQRHLMRRLIAQHRPKSEALQFLARELDSATIPRDRENTIRMLGELRWAESIPLLRRLLAHPSDRVAALAARTISLFPYAGAAAIPDIVSRYEQLKTRDPGLDSDDAYRMAVSLLRLRETKTVLRDLAAIVHSGRLKAPRAAQDIYRSLDLLTASSVLIHTRRANDASVRLCVARLFLEGVSPTVYAEVREWYEKEADVWARFALAFVLLTTDATPAIDALREFERVAPRDTLEKFARSAGAGSYRELVDSVSSGRALAGLPATTRKLLQLARPGAPDLTPGTLRSDSGALSTFVARRADRMRSVRHSLWSSSAAQRKAGAVTARSIMNPELIPILISLLEDDDFGVRQASAETLGSLDRGPLAGYDPSVSRDALAASVASVRKAFGEKNLGELIPRLPVLQLTSVK